MQKSVERKIRIYRSIDTTKDRGVDQMDDNAYLEYEIEYLNSLNFLMFLFALTLQPRGTLFGYFF